MVEWFHTNSKWDGRVAGKSVWICGISSQAKGGVVQGLGTSDAFEFE